MNMIPSRFLVLHLSFSVICYWQMTLSRSRFVPRWSLFVIDSLGQTSNNTCQRDDYSIGFGLPSSVHSAYNPSTNCFLSQCSNQSDSCRPSPTLCYIYRSPDNQTYCAPGSLCEIVEFCNTSSYRCSSNTSVCILNSCCSPKAICLPLVWTTLCPKISKFAIWSFSFYSILI